MKHSTIKRVTRFLNRVQFSRGGFSLIELMLAVGILSIMTLGISMSVNHMLVEQRSFGEKFSILNLENSILTVSQNNTTCLANLGRAATPIDISDANLTTPSATVVSLDELRAGPLATSPLLAKVGQSLPGKNNNMVVTAIKLDQIIPTGVTDEYKAILKVDFDPGTMARAHKSAEVEQIFTIAGTSAAASFKKCGANTSATDPGASPTPTPSSGLIVGTLKRDKFLPSLTPPPGLSPCSTVMGAACIHPAPQCYISKPPVGTGVYSCSGTFLISTPSGGTDG